MNLAVEWSEPGSPRHFITDDAGIIQATWLRDRAELDRCECDIRPLHSQQDWLDTIGLFSEVYQ